MIYAIAQAANSKPQKRLLSSPYGLTSSSSEATMYVLQLQLSVASRFMNAFELNAFQLDFSMFITSLISADNF